MSEGLSQVDQGAFVERRTPFFQAEVAMDPEQRGRHLPDTDGPQRMATSSQIWRAGQGQAVDRGARQGIARKRPKTGEADTCFVSPSALE